MIGVLAWPHLDKVLGSPIDGCAQFHSATLQDGPWCTAMLVPAVGALTIVGQGG